MLVPNEVIAEVVYVLEKVYKVKNDKICQTLLDLFKCRNVAVDDCEVVEEALHVFSRRNLDFVDTLLYAYNKVSGHEVFTFDKKLNKLLEEEMLLTPFSRKRYNLAVLTIRR